jgi:ligand-binding SRPBCC domain-containing protein
MGIYKLTATQKIPASKEAVWDFVSSPKNLKEITPDYMGFEILGSLPEKMYAGMFIQYIVKPVLGIPLKWVTEITHVEEGKYFVDEQRVGPYNIWHHEHHLEEIEGGILMTDIIHYQAPLGILGDLAVALFIKRQLQGIFAYREKAIVERFGEMK